MNATIELTGVAITLIVSILKGLMSAIVTKESIALRPGFGFQDKDIGFGIHGSRVNCLKDMKSEAVLISLLMVVLLIGVTILTNVYSIQIFVIQMALVQILMVASNADVVLAFKVLIYPNMSRVYTMTEVMHLPPPKQLYANLHVKSLGKFSFFIS